MGRVFGLLIALLVARAGATLGQNFSIGSWDVPDGTFGASPITVINMAHQSNQDAKLTSVRFQWSAAPCPAAVKIKTFSNFNFMYEFSMVLQEERGPFDIEEPIQTIPLRPPLDIHPGEMIAISSVTTCGGPVRSLSRDPYLGSIVVPGDANHVQSDLRFCGCPTVAGFPLLQAFAGGDRRIRRVVPFRQ